MQYLQAWSLLENYHETYRGCKKLQKNKKVKKIKKNFWNYDILFSKSKTNTMFYSVLFFCLFFLPLIQIKIKQLPFVFLFTI